MKNSLNTFKEKFSRGFVHPNLFKVEFQNLHKSLNNYSDILSFACKSAQIPGTTFNESKYYHQGYYNKFVSGADYDPINLTFIVDGGNKDNKESKIINAFDIWNALIFNKGKYGFKEDYICDIKFTMFNRDGSILYENTIIDAYPTNITSFELSSDNKFNVMEYNITFNFLKFE